MELRTKGLLGPSTSSKVVPPLFRTDQDVINDVADEVRVMLPDFIDGIVSIVAKAWLEQLDRRAR